MAEAIVRVEGLDQFHRDLRKLGREYRNSWDLVCSDCVSGSPTIALPPAS